MFGVPSEQSTLDFKKNTLLLSVTDIIRKELHYWTSNYGELLYRESYYSAYGDSGHGLIVIGNFSIRHNKLTHLGYLCHKWNDFIVACFSNFLPFEAYSFMHEYNKLNNKRIVTLDRVYDIQLGKSPNLSLTELFNFVDLDVNEQQSIYDVRQVMESTMFDIFDVYLKFAIEKNSQLKKEIKEVMHTNKCQFNFSTVDGGMFDFNSIDFARKQIQYLNNLMLRLSDNKVANAQQFVDLFNQQITYLYNNVKAKDIVHITFGTADIAKDLGNENIQMFPLTINSEGLYTWHNDAKSFGLLDSSYFGIHIDPIFADQDFFEKFLIKNNLYSLSNQFHISEYKECNIFTKPTLTKRNLFLFNQGSIDNVFRCYSKKASNYGSGEQFIDISLNIIENLLKKDVIVIVGSHLSSEEEQDNIVGPFFLNELAKLREEYPDFYIAFNNDAALPYIKSSVEQEDMIYFFNNKIGQINSSTSSIINNQSAKTVDPNEEAGDENSFSRCLLL